MFIQTQEIELFIIETLNMFVYRSAGLIYLM